MPVKIIVVASQAEPIPVRVNRPDWLEFLEY